MGGYRDEDEDGGGWEKGEDEGKWERGEGEGGHTDLENQPRRRNRSPCCPGLRRGSFEAVADIPAGASLAQTRRGVRRGSGLG